MATEALAARPMLRTVSARRTRPAPLAPWWVSGCSFSGATTRPSTRASGQRRDAREVHEQHAGLPARAYGASGDFTSPAGYLDTELFDFFAPLLLLLFAIGAGARAIAGEEERQRSTSCCRRPCPATRRGRQVRRDGARRRAPLGAAVVSVPLTGPPFDLSPSLGDITAPS